MKKRYPVFIDETAQLFEKVYISAGIRGMQVIISPDQLYELFKGKYADLI